MGQISTKIAIFDSFVQNAEPLSVPNRNLSTLWTRTRMSLSFSVIFRLPTSLSGLDRGEIRVKFHPISPILADFHTKSELSYAQTTID